MSTVFEGRVSDSPYIEMVWRGHTEPHYRPTCPADVRWNLLLVRENGVARVTIEGPTTKAITKYRADESEFLVIKFKLGTFMPHLPAGNFRDGDVILPEAAGRSFWLKGSAWQLPNYDNAETFVDRLVRAGLLVHEPIIAAVLQDQLPEVSFRTVRRRFLLATGLTHGSIRQIERAQQAATLLEQGIPILDAVYEAGYADQPHLTRSLKRYYGQTPAQIARVSQAE